MQNVYDAAHSLAHAIKDSDEFKKFRELEAVIMGNESLKNMIADIQKRRMEIQALQIQGIQPDQEIQEKFQEMVGVAAKDPVAAEYLQAEMRFNQLMTDVSKILGDVMGF